MGCVYVRSIEVDGRAGDGERSSAELRLTRRLPHNDLDIVADATKLYPEWSRHSGMIGPGPLNHCLNFPLGPLVLYPERHLAHKACSPARSARPNGPNRRSREHDELCVRLVEVV